VGISHTAAARTLGLVRATRRWRPPGGGPCRSRSSRRRGS
jgi:hypothetical protein